MIDASPVAAPEARVALDFHSTCARMDSWGLSEVAKAWCGAVGTFIKSPGRPFCSCSRCAPGAGGGLGCAMSGKKWNQQPSKRNQGLTFKKVFLFYPQQYLLQELEINPSTSQTSRLKKMIYLAGHRLETNSDEDTESILWFSLFCDRIISSAKLVHICWITYLIVSAPNLPYASFYFRVKQPKLINKWYASISVRNAD